VISLSCFGFVAVVPDNPETQTVSHSSPKPCDALQRKFGADDTIASRRLEFYKCSQLFIGAPNEMLIVAACASATKIVRPLGSTVVTHYLPIPQFDRLLLFLLPAKVEDSGDFFGKLPYASSVERERSRSTVEVGVYRAANWGTESKATRYGSGQNPPRIFGQLNPTPQCRGSPRS
jgi:hypothetical protein